MLKVYTKKHRKLELQLIGWRRLLRWTFLWHMVWWNYCCFWVTWANMHTTYNYFTTLHFHPFPQLCCYVILAFFLEKIIRTASNTFYQITTLKVGYKHRYGLNFADSFSYNLKVFGRIYFQADCRFLNLRQQMVIK